MTIYNYICWIFFYSVIGWIYESILCSAMEGRWINRGFLNGPYCPIYGFGAVLDVFVLQDIGNIFVLFYLGAVLACTLEYSTSWLMEKLFQARWWDYSSHQYNLNGRISLAGAVVFGIFSVLIVRLIHPEITNLTNALSASKVTFIAYALLAVIAIDCTVTVINVIGFNKRLRLVDMRLQITEIKIQLSEIRTLITKLNLQEIRILRAFPKLKSRLYDDALILIQEAFRSSIWKKR